MQIRKMMATGQHITVGKYNFENVGKCELGSKRSKDTNEIDKRKTKI